MNKLTIISCFLLMLTLLSQTSVGDEINMKDKKIAILGSSVAAGWVTNHKEHYDMQNGYAYRLARLLDTKGWKITNISFPGDNTTAILERMDEDLSPINPNYVIIGLSMGNEGLESGNPVEVSETYENGLYKIIEKCREKNYIPIVGLCYANDNYTEEQYQYLKKMNLLVNLWDVPSINFLGAFDDSYGHFPKGLTFEGDHPNNRGHEEMFYGIVPSLFDALEQNKPIPKYSSNPNFITIEGKKNETPLSFIPDDLVHSFSIAFKIRTSSIGSIASINYGNGHCLLEINQDGQISYTSSKKENISSSNELIDKNWHQIVISHRHLNEETLLFVDGALIGKVTEKIESRQFVIGGTCKADYQHLLIYRAALNDDEVAAMHKGAFLQSSLEIYSPLNKNLQKNAASQNLAQSLSQLMAYPDNTEEKISALEEKIKAAQTARQNEPIFTEKIPIELNPQVFADYIGDYEVAPGDTFKITTEDDKLYFHDRGQKIGLSPEAKNKFFVKYPGELTVTFFKNQNNEVTQLIFQINTQKIPAKKIN